MPSFNRVLLMGNLTRDPEIRQVGQSAVTLAKLGLAVNERRKDKNGQPVDIPCFIDVDVWERPAELCGQYLRKGSAVFVEGILQMDTWERDGQKRTKHKVRALSIKFLNAGPRLDSVKDQQKDSASPVDAGSISQEAGDLAKDDENVPF